MKELDCVVVGSGIYGLAAAKQYHVTHPDESLVVYEASHSLGGTWSEERIYPTLKTNNMFGTFELPDFPMNTQPTKLRPGQDHLPGAMVNAYFKAYASHFGIDKLLQFNTKVTVAEHQSDSEDGGWTLTLQDTANEPSHRPPTQVFARRLIVATGLTSEPLIRTFPGQDTFGGPIFHARHFAENYNTTQTATSATVYGTGKFAWDVAYSYATAGVPVNWVIRSTGYGASWVSTSRVSPFRLWLEKLAHTRLMTWFSPSIWADTDGFSSIQRFLQRTWFGRFLVGVVWKIISSDVIQRCGFNEHPEAAKLKPWVPILYASASLGILNYDQDFSKLVHAGMIKVHIADIVKLTPGHVHLTDGSSFKSDVIMAHSGWQQSPSIKFLPEGVEAELGLPHSSDNGEWDRKTGEHAKLVKRADSEILTRLPVLRNQPQLPNFVPVAKQNKSLESTPSPKTGYMMYRFLAPPSAKLLRYHDIAFAGFLFNLSTLTTAHVGGLWISAYFDGKLVNNPTAMAANEESESYKKLRYENVLYNRFGRWRYPFDWDLKAPSFVFDTITYHALLLRDLGLETHRKRNLFQEIFGAYGVEDYRNVNEEWAAIQAAKIERIY